MLLLEEVMWANIVCLIAYLVLPLRVRRIAFGDAARRMRGFGFG